MIAITLTPGATTLVARRAVYCGAVPKPAASCREALGKSAAVSRSVARGEPVHDIGTGGLARQRIDAAEGLAPAGLQPLPPLLRQAA
ncbi:hypothetical protein [Hydrocarboniphaga sp.]|uniref:hypothetical protein n=1 Tax=Hydrocarboniphaga sp. TaxID=2033016 RepID=UPI003D0C3640